MKNCNGIVSSIYNGSAVDGPGIRCVVFMAGCNFRCPFCHNPETFEFKGINYTADELFNKLNRYKNYIINGGITFSGGEPFLQAEFCTEVMQRLKEENIHTAIETNGSIIDKKLISTADLIIIDIKNYDKNITSNSGNFLKACLKLNKPVQITNVIIKGINDDIFCLKQLKDMTVKFPNIIKTEFLPFKKLCIEKYKELNIPFPYIDKEEPEEDYMQNITQIYNNL